MRLKVYLDRAQRWRWRLIQADHSMMGCSSGGFNTKEQARKNAYDLADALLIELSKEVSRCSQL